MNAPVHPLPAEMDPGRDSRLEADDAEHSGTDLLSALWRLVAIVRRRWLVVLASVVVCAVGAGLAAQTLQPRWRAKATILLHMSGPQVLDKVQGVNDDEEERRTGYRDYYETQRQIMGSRAVAERALAELGLANDPVFLGIASLQTEEERVAATAKIDAVDRLQTLVSVGEIRNSRLVKIGVEYPDAQLAAEIANAIADAYLEYVQLSRERFGADAQADIATEKAKAAQRVTAAERAFEAFKQAERITSIGQLEQFNAQSLVVLNGHSKDVEAERIQLESLLQEAQRLHGKGNLSATNLLTESERSVFARMRGERLDAERMFADVDVTYGPKHEEHRKAKRRLGIIDQKLSKEGSDLIESLSAKVNAARTAERKLNGSLGRAQAQALRVTDLEREYRELERQAKTAAEDYRFIAQRDTEIAITNRVEEGSIEILDRATAPSVAIFPNKLMLLLLGVAAGLGGGVLLALSVDFRDQRIRGSVDLERALAAFGVPLLGQLPQLPSDARLGAGNVRGQRRQRDLYAHLFPQSLMAERCRGVRTSLAFGARGGPLRSIMVTSPSSAEGKSSTALNLALSFCQANKRVVLVDADMRRPRIHHVFPEAEDVDEHGLSALLKGRCAIEDALLVAPADAPDNLAVLPCGAIPDNPAELVDTPAFRRLLVDLQDHCDLVIVDCPPVLPVTDPVILARHVDGVVLVGRCGSTTRGQIQQAIGQLARGDTNVVGVVLNAVDARRERYGYSPDYYTYRSTRPQQEPA